MANTSAEMEQKTPIFFITALLAQKRMHITSLPVFSPCNVMSMIDSPRQLSAPESLLRTERKLPLASQPVFLYLALLCRLHRPIKKFLCTLWNLIHVLHAPHLKNSQVHFFSGWTRAKISMFSVVKSKGFILDKTTKVWKLIKQVFNGSGGSRISQREVPTPEFGAKTFYVGKIFAENCMIMKEIGPRGGVPRAFPWVRQ